MKNTAVKLILCIALILTQSLTLKAQFTEQFSDLYAYYGGSIVWGDYDNDGDLDMLFYGYELTKTYDTIYYVIIYDNTPTGFASRTVMSNNGCAEYVNWADFNNNGKLDIITNGEYTGFIPFTKIFMNINSDFYEVYKNPEATIYGGNDIGDYDNDGFKDLLITGYDSSFTVISKILKNNGNAEFDEIYLNSLTPVSEGTVASGDFDSDGDLDILLTGNDGCNSISKIYENSGSGFTEVFPESIIGLMWSKAKWFDYDNDGDLDIAISGYSSGNNFKIYQNTGNGFVEIYEKTGIKALSISVGDYDNDGDLDILLPQSEAKIFRNDGATFTEIDAGIRNISNSIAHWGDYDNDGDLDIIQSGFDYDEDKTRVTLYSNNLDIANSAAISPTNLSNTITENNVTLVWDKTTDTETPQDGLSYNIEVYKNNNKSKFQTLVAKIERVQYSENGYTLRNLANGEYTWKVQAFDTGLKGGEFSEEQTFTIGSTGNTYYADASVCDGESYTFGTQTLTESGVYTEVFQAVDGSDSTVVLSLIVNPVYNLPETVSICSGSNYTFPDGTMQSNITSPIVHISNLQSKFGCDSIIETSLTVNQNQSYDLSEEVNICEGEDYVFPDGTVQYNITDQVVYQSNLKSAFGCDSIIETTVNIDPLPEPDFGYECDSVKVSFKNESLHSEFYFWEFGDGTNSFLKNPTHTYPELGEYTVRLKSNNDCGSISIYKTIEVIYTPPTTGVETVNNSEILVYPNPANDKIYIDYDKEVLVEFHNLIGTKVLESNKTEIDVSGLNNGTYIVLIKNNNGELIQRVKIIKE